MNAPAFNADELRTFVKALAGHENAPVTWQMFYDPKDGTKHPELAKFFTATVEQALPTIIAAQHQYCGVYIAIQQMNGRGRFNADVEKYRTFFADVDGVTPPAWPATPHIVTQRDETHQHAFWLVDGVEDFEQYRAIQMRIALYSNSDTQITDGARVARAPGTLHLKDPHNPKTYKVVVDNTDAFKGAKYSPQQIIDAFKLDDAKQAILDNWLNSREALKVGSGFADSEIGRQRFIKFMTTAAEPATLGSGTATLIRVAGYGYDQGLPLQVSQELLWEHYNPLCVPPWEEREKDHFYDVVERAYRYARNEPGSRTAVASFTQLEPIPVPAAPPTPDAIVASGDRINKRDAAALAPMMNGKSAHYEMAKVFDGLVFDGTRLICCEKIFYGFNGRSWQVVSDAVLRAQIQRFYSKLKPADKLISNIFGCLRDLVNVQFVENGIWLNTGIMAKDIVCFKNGLVDLSQTPPRIMPHTPEFFTFNELRYDYNEAASCPQWLKFLNEIWDYDPQLIDQLQEFMGYCMVNDVSFQRFAVLVGKSRAGKGVIAKIITELVGEHNTTAPSLSNLIKDSALHKMAVASVGLIPDAHSVSPAKRDEVLAMFKALTGGDPVDYHVMYKGTQTSVFKIKFVLSTNGMPEFVDSSGALANRMLVFPFYKSFADKMDSTLADRLLTEIPGIAQWALRGLNRLRQRGKFTEALAGQREKQNIAEDMNPMGRFMADMCRVKEGAFTTSDELYRAYVLWCKANEVSHPLSQNKVTREINSSPMGVVQDRVYHGDKQVRGFKGLALNMFDPIV